MTLPTTINGSYLNGVNLPWEGGYAVDFGTGGWGYLADWNKVSADLTALHNEGGTVARWWVFGDGRYSPTFNSDGTVNGLNQGFLDDIGHALQLASQNNVKLMLDLTDFIMFNPASDGGNGVQIGGHANIVTNPTVQQSFLDNALKPLLQYVAASPYRDAVLGYDIINEPEAQIAGGYNGSDFFRGPAQFNLSDVQNFVARATSYIHTYGGPNALATVGSAMPIWAPLWMGLGLDFYEVHYYPWMDFNGQGAGLPNANDITSDTGQHLDKPVIVGEFPTADASYGFNDTNYQSAEWYLNLIHDRGYAGEIGWSINAGDGASNWSAFAPVFTDWIQHHPDGGGGDLTPPTVLSVVTSGVGITNGSGNLNAGDVVTLTVNMSEPTTVSGGTPSLTLNDGGTATYQSGSGSSALAFSYSVAAGQNTSDLTVTAFNANGATITDRASNLANMAGAVTNPPGTLQVDTTTNSDSDSGPEIPLLTIGSHALTLPAQGSVALPISVAAVDSDDMISVTISGLTKYESITDNLDNITFRPKHGSVTLTAAEVNSGLTLNSTYRGRGHPVNTLTVTATNSTAGEAGTSAAQTITVTDPPANSTGRVDEGATAFAQAQHGTANQADGALQTTATIAASELQNGDPHGSAVSQFVHELLAAPDHGGIGEQVSAFAHTAAALIAQFGAAGFQAGTDSGGPIGAPPQAHLAEDTSFLTKPHS